MRCQLKYALTVQMYINNSTKCVVKRSFTSKSQFKPTPWFSEYPETFELLKSVKLIGQSQPFRKLLKFKWEEYRVPKFILKPCGLKDQNLKSEFGRLCEAMMYDKFRYIYHHGGKRNNENRENNVLRYFTLFWMLRDFPYPDDFVSKIEMVPNHHWSICGG